MIALHEKLPNKESASEPSLRVLAPLLGRAASYFLNPMAGLRATGSRLRDITKIMFEVEVPPKRIYQGLASKEEVIAFMKNSAFQLVIIENQSYGQEENLSFSRIGNPGRAS